MNTTGREQVPLKEGFWSPATADRGPRLIGSRCSNCGELYFPKKLKDFCVHCQHTGLEEVLLSPRGRLAAVTLAHRAPAGGFYHGPVPYAYGLVDLDDGVRVLSQLTADELQSIKTGAEAELVIKPLYEDEEGREVVTFMFTPVV